MYNNITTVKQLFEDIPKDTIDKQFIIETDLTIRKKATHYIAHKINIKGNSKTGKNFTDLYHSILKPNIEKKKDDDCNSHDHWSEYVFCDLIHETNTEPNNVLMISNNRKYCKMYYCDKESFLEDCKKFQDRHVSRKVVTTHSHKIGEIIFYEKQNHKTIITYEKDNPEHKLTQEEFKEINFHTRAWKYHNVHIEKINELQNLMYTTNPIKKFVGQTSFR